MTLLNDLATETRLLILVAHVHRAACTRSRLLRALDVTPAEFQAAVQALFDSQYVETRYDLALITAAGAQHVRELLAAQAPAGPIPAPQEAA